MLYESINEIANSKNKEEQYESQIKYLYRASSNLKKHLIHKEEEHMELINKYD